VLFKGLLNLQRDTWARLRDKRKAKRYPVGHGFPLRATLQLIGRDRPDPKATNTMGWGGNVVNVSNEGLNVQMPPGAQSFRGEETVVTLRLEDHELKIPCTVAHFRVFSSHATCGLKLNFNDPAVEHGYHQLIESVISGSTLEPVKAKSTGKNPPGTVREQYEAENGVTLTAWRQKKTNALDSFELVIDDVCIRGQHVSPFYEAFRRDSADGDSTRTAISAPDYRLVRNPHPEIRQLFRWVVGNLAKSIPADLRSFVSKVK
jgi:hypothetical protein